MEGFSFWEKNVGLYDCDIAIIGGGFTGSYAAYFLSKFNESLKISIFEKSALPIGASTRNAGFACFGSPSESLSVIKRHGLDKLSLMLKKRYHGLELMREVLGDKAIDFNPCGGYEVFLDDDLPMYEDCSNSLGYLNTICYENLGLDDVYVEVESPIDGFSRSLYNQYEGSINPAKALKSLQKLCRENGIQIHRGADVTQLESHESDITFMINESFKVKADKAILATNGYTSITNINDMRPARNSVLITKPINDLNLQSCFHFNEGYVYFRNVDDRILLGGGRNIDMENEFTSDSSHNPLIKNYLKDFLLTNILSGYDDSIIDYWWTGTMGVGENLTPIVEWKSEHILYGIRMNGMGVALSSTVGKQLASLISESI